MTFQEFISTISPNYMLCISWRDSNNTMYRYSLWNGVGEVLYFNIQPYTGQKIAKNFRLEIWSTKPSNLIPSGSVYDNTGTFTLNGLTTGAYYTWTPASLDNTLTNGAQVLNASSGVQIFQAQGTSITMQSTGLVSGLITSSIYPQAVVSNTESINLLTSILGKLDYRYANDFILVNPDAINTGFGEQGTPNFPVPIVFPNGSTSKSN